ncbi:MAG: hypothetical protein V3T72_15305 [Thermoanaerobaculia bacterium]
MDSSHASWILREQLPAVAVLLLAVVAFGWAPIGVDGAVPADAARVSHPREAVEIGTNDFRVSETGADGDPDRDASNAAVAYNSTDGEYLVVWQADDPAAGSGDDDFQIVGQRIDAVTGLEIGGQFRISDHVLGNRDFGAFRPAVAYNSTDNEYLVVWEGDDGVGPLVEGESEIFGQRLDASPGSFGEVGANDFRISSMGVDGNRDFGAFRPAVAYNGTGNEYLVVWEGDDAAGTGAGALVEGESEIFGQRLDATPGNFGEVGTDDFRISSMGVDGNRDFGAFHPAVAYNRVDNQYLVVWDGDDDAGPLVEGESEIFGQRLDASPGSFGEVGADDFRISDMGADGNRDFGAFHPAVAVDVIFGSYLVTWEGDDDAAGTGAPPLVEGEFEIFGQRLDPGGGEEGTDFRISDMGGDGDRNFGAFRPAVIYQPATSDYLVVWHGNEDLGPSPGPGPALALSELEIYGQRLDDEGVEVGDNDFRISDMGWIDGNPAFDAFEPAVVYNPDRYQSLVAWHGDDDTGALVDDELEVYAGYPGIVADLQIEIQPSSPTGIPGEMLDYSIEVTNAGPNDVTAASVSDGFLVALACTWTCASVGVGASCTAGPVAGDLVDVVDLPAATSVAYAVTCDVDPGVAGVLFDVATVLPPPDVVDPVPVNNAGIYKIEFLPIADLSVTKTDGLTEAHPGDPVTYTVEVFSAGPSHAPGTMVVDPFPAPLGGVEWTCVASAGSSCPAVGTSNLDEIVDLLAGGTATFIVSGTIAVDFVGDLVNTAMAATAAGVTDPALDDNADTDVTAVTSPAEIVATKTVSGDFRVGGTVVYEIILVNVSPYEQFDDPGSDEFVDTLPPELEPVSAVADSGAVTLDAGSGLVTWNGSIPGGGEVAIAVEAIIAYGSAGELVVNQGAVFYDGDGDGVNDTTVLTDDPLVVGDADSTVFEVLDLVEIPTLSTVGFVLLAGLLAAVARISIRRRIRSLR